VFKVCHIVLEQEKVDKGHQGMKNVIEEFTKQETDYRHAIILLKTEEEYV
jgi:hypothetical protein